MCRQGQEGKVIVNADILRRTKFVFEHKITWRPVPRQNFLRPTLHSIFPFKKMWRKIFDDDYTLFGEGRKQGFIPGLYKSRNLLDWNE